MEYRLDKTGNLHVLFGRADFDDEALVANMKAVQVRPEQFSSPSRTCSVEASPL